MHAYPAVPRPANSIPLDCSAVPAVGSKFGRRLFALDKGFKLCSLRRNPSPSTLQGVSHVHFLLLRIFIAKFIRSSALYSAVQRLVFLRLAGLRHLHPPCFIVQRIPTIFGTRICQEQNSKKG